MTTSNAAADAAAKNSAEKVHEKRRALGRGLESLLPGPRAVSKPAPGVEAGTTVAAVDPVPETLEAVQAMASPAVAADRDRKSVV